MGRRIARGENTALYLKESYGRTLLLSEEFFRTKANQAHQKSNRENPRGLRRVRPPGVLAFCLMPASCAGRLRTLHRARLLGRVLSHLFHRTSSERGENKVKGLAYSPKKSPGQLAVYANTSGCCKRLYHGLRCPTGR